MECHLPVQTSGLQLVLVLVLEVAGIVYLEIQFGQVLPTAWGLR